MLIKVMLTKKRLHANMKNKILINHQIIDWFISRFKLQELMYKK